MNKDSTIEGLRERIAIAKSPEDVSKLLDEGSTYASASDKTRRSWKHTADKRLAELAKPVKVVAGDMMDGIGEAAPVTDTHISVQGEAYRKEKQARLGENYGMRRRHSPLAAVMLVAALSGGVR